ncbi:MAG: sigma-70 family RNA polymerase sigma factor [Candidatus Hodarchaeales archaeon]
MRDSHHLYMDEVNKHPLLTRKEEIVVFLKAKNQNRKALNTLISANLKFVVSVARNYRNQGVELEDLIAVGNIGLYHAFKDFDHTLGNKFISFAVNRIRSYILEELANQSRFLKVNTGEAYKKSKVLKAISKLEHKLQRTPTLEEISKATKYPMARLLEMETLEVQASIDGSNLSEIIPDQPKNSENQDDLKEKLLNFVNNAPLSTQQRDVITRYTGMGYGGKAYTLEEIGDKYNRTRERIRLIKDDAVEVLERFSRNQKSQNNLYLTPTMMEV